MFLNNGSHYHQASASRNSTLIKHELRLSTIFPLGRAIKRAANAIETL